MNDTKITECYEDKIQLLLSDARGIYIPRDAMDLELFLPSIDLGDIKTLKDGPDNDDYWDVWDYVTDMAYAIDKDGVKWTLYQDGDLWAIREDMSEDDWENFSG